MSNWYGDIVTNRFYDGVTARFDTTKPFGDATSWQTFDASQLFGPSNMDLYDASFFHMGGFDLRDARQSVCAGNVKLRRDNIDCRIRARAVVARYQIVVLSEYPIPPGSVDAMVEAPPMYVH